MLSCKKNSPFPLSKFPTLVDLFLNVFMNSLVCTFGSLEKDVKNEMNLNLKKENQSTFIELFQSEWNEMHEFTENSTTILNEKLIHSERAISIATLFRNFTFQPENAMYLASHSLFSKVLNYIVLLDMSIVKSAQGISSFQMSVKQSNLLEHYKNLIVILSNIGTRYILSKTHYTYYTNLLIDFLSVKESIYAYLSLEALAKLSLVEENSSLFSCSFTGSFQDSLQGSLQGSFQDSIEFKESKEPKGMKDLTSLLLDFLPTQGLLSDATPEMIASWELASLLIYHLSSLEENHSIMLETKGFISVMFRIISSGLGSQVHADYIQIITLRILKSLHQCLLTFPGHFISFESTFVDLILKLKVSGISKTFADEVGLLLSECIHGLHVYE